MEKKKNYGVVMVSPQKANDGKVEAYIEIRINKFEQKYVPAIDGKKSRMQISGSVVNKEKAIALIGQKLGEDNLFTHKESNGSNYNTLYITLFDRDADNIVKLAKEGNIIGFFVTVSLFTKTDGTKTPNITASAFNVVRFANSTQNSNGGNGQPSTPQQEQNISQPDNDFGGLVVTTDELSDTTVGQSKDHAPAISEDDLPF